MITTRVLNFLEYGKYADWLLSQDRDTLAIYFGYTISPEHIEKLVDQIKADPLNHYFIVAEDERLNWAGTIHMALGKDRDVEFGIMVGKEYRGQGVGTKLIEQAILWARNRHHVNLYMHCLSHNKAIQHLCRKHGLKITTEYGESETRVTLPSPTLGTLGEEFVHRNFNVMQYYTNKQIDTFYRLLAA